MSRTRETGHESPLPLRETERAVAAAPGGVGRGLRPKSAVYGGGKDLPGGGRMPWTIFFVPVPHWSDGSAAAAHL